VARELRKLSIDEGDQRIAEPGIFVGGVFGGDADSGVIGLLPLQLAR
jgi:hypothetical protein